jgi:tetratricopeptide (TPR) repeat protein
MKKYREAIDAYEACAMLRGWCEEAAWACYRTAQCYVELKQYQNAVDACARGLVRHPGIAEIPWLASYCEYQLRRYDFAVHWAEISIALGWYQGIASTIPRVGFRHLPGLYEAPYDVLRFAFRCMSKDNNAIEADGHYNAALEARLARTSRGKGFPSTQTSETLHDDRQE